jgi:hypothetical protein
VKFYVVNFSSKSGLIHGTSYVLDVDEEAAKSRFLQEMKDLGFHMAEVVNAYEVALDTPKCFICIDGDS